ncbi:ATP-binding protein [Herbiconiux sp. VKM Ac-2851]|uniref:sensor histidine kinase n=1 Tax=Herbiconiux sp. VKM Ac-2851 TaxID=2739025 RepID=UPI0015647B86|nr:ATP-binding protein [Herbiconiux sp. VKM Ac-2851]NQX35052.1 HAMP domain-containing protein [Herbiconiux sp. VKM Ac-2851]
MGEGRRFRSVRARITVITTLVVAVSAGLGGAGFAFVLSQSLLDQATTAAELELDRFEAAVDAGGPGALTEHDGYAQVVRDGVVLGASDQLEDAPPLVTAGGGDDDGDAGDLTGRVVTVPGDDDRLVVAAKEVDDGLLVAGVDDGPRAEAVGTTVVLLLVAVPLLVAAMALVTWLAVGRALRPVERIRLDTEQVTAADLGRRIATPGSGDEIDRLAQTMNRMLERLDESQRRQRRFVSDASHELRSPISALRQNAEVALAYPDRLPVERLGRTVAEESARMAELVDGLLLLARADERGLVPDARDVDLDDLALAEARRLRTLAPHLTIDAAGVSATRVRGDTRMLERALRNLGDNAARHARGRIAISCTVLDGAALLTVDDDGPGIPPAERDRVFERFVRLDDSRARDSGGSGLGLPIVASIAAAHGGTATAAASPLGGARLELRLPPA